MSKITLIHNANIYTVDSQFRTAEAIAFEQTTSGGKGKILAIGSDTDLLAAYESSATTIINAQQKYLYPGFFDAHCHLLRYAQMLGEVSLLGAKSFKEVVIRVKKYAEKHPNKKAILGRAWDQNLWPNKKFPTKTTLDEHFPDLPVLLTRIDLHAAIANQAALDLANFTQKTTIEGGIIEQKNGQLTGILIDNAVKIAENCFPKPSQEDFQELLIEAQNHCFAVGLTTLNEALVHQNEAELIEKMQESEALKMRFYCMILATENNKKYYLQKGISKTSRLHIRAFKYFADGALGSRGSWLLSPYSDAPTSGLQLLDFEDFVSDLREYHSKGFQVATHAIGDAANRLVLDAYGAVLKGKNDLRWRLEHAQIVQDEDLPKFAQYSITPSIQATHATSDMYWVEERLGAARVGLGYRYQELLEQVGFVAAGSDFPVEQINPLLGFYAAVFRQDAKAWPSNGFQIENALSKKAALQAMTIWAAYSNFEEKEKGSLEVGKLADITWLDTDLMNAEQGAILGAKVLGTFVGGELVYSSYAQ